MAQIRVTDRDRPVPAGAVLRHGTVDKGVQMPIRVTQRDWWNVNRILVAVATFDVLAIVIAVALNAATDDRAPLAAGLAVIAVITFFGFILAQLERLRHSGIATGEFGLSVAATVLVVYLCLLSFSVFDSSAIPDEGLGQAVFSDFTIFAAIVVGFFVAASAIAQITSPGAVRSPEAGAAPPPAAEAVTVEKPPPNGA